MRPASAAAQITYTSADFLPGRTSAACHWSPIGKRTSAPPADFIKGGICMSGMYDMKPVRLSKRSEYIKFTDDMEQAMSSRRQIDRLRVPLIVTYGTNDTPEFQRQARDFATAVKAAGKPVE